MKRRRVYESSPMVIVKWAYIAKESAFRTVEVAQDSQRGLTETDRNVYEGCRHSGRTKNLKAPSQLHY